MLDRSKREELHVDISAAFSGDCLQEVVGKNVGSHMDSVCRYPGFTRRYLVFVTNWIGLKDEDPGLLHSHMSLLLANYHK
jgi:hypothetical protein